MNIAQIENNLQKLMKSFNKTTFIYDLLLAYGLPKASITRLKKGNLNLSKKEGELSWKKKVLFKEVFDQDLHVAVSDMATEIKHNQRFVIATDYNLFLAIDTKTNDKLDVELKDLQKHSDFFLPWAGKEKTQHPNENPADVKAAERMAKLFDEIKKDNPDDSPEFIHGLNVFLSRVLFCFFAEDTNIFQEGQFTNGIDSHTQEDGSDLHDYFNRLFEVLNTEKNNRCDLPDYLNNYPYVNGGLFRQRYPAPTFTRRSRKAIIESGELNWAAINPDIFGSMIQAVITPEHRGGLGMHYTSVPNIMKVIDPLFLDDLKEAYVNTKGNKKKIAELLNRIHNIKIFDPACGSGNFLIIAYKELRKLEMKIFKESGMMALSEISLSQFYGIELDDFAHEIAQLSLWLAEHQMNTEFFRNFGRTKSTLPLQETGNIIHGNACRIEWENVCPRDKDQEIYILGNPPYHGKKEQTKEQKEDLAYVCKHLPNYKNLDFISCWFIKVSDYMRDYFVKSAFVSTNSICQGEQVGLLWPSIIISGIQIAFAHNSFMWKNSAKHNAGVAVVIIGLSNKNDESKYLYITKSQNQTIKIITNKINPYLTAGSDVIIKKRTLPISDIPEMHNGSMANDDSNFFITENEYTALDKPLIRYFRKALGARELLYSINRYCLWLENKDIQEAIRHEFIKAIVDNVKKYRSSSKRKATRKLSSVPHWFGEVRHLPGPSLIVPGLSAERREYIPVSILSNSEIITNLAQAIYEFEPWLFGLVSSKINILWVQATSGYFKKDLRYSPVLSYNNFPFPPISSQRKQEITQCVFRILEERERHPEKTLAQLYDPDKMPNGLREAHNQNDLVIERCYRSKPFESDEERLEYLFKLYEKMIEEEKNEGSLFAKPKTKRKK